MRGAINLIAEIPVFWKRVFPHCNELLQLQNYIKFWSKSRKYDLITECLLKCSNRLARLTWHLVGSWQCSLVVAGSQFNFLGRIILISYKFYFLRSQIIKISFQLRLIYRKNCNYKKIWNSVQNSVDDIAKISKFFRNFIFSFLGF